ncbi:MAG: hypothetical protein ABSG96_23295 [Terracidiphilus sp.]|jgi:hypothetical protein
MSLIKKIDVPRHFAARRAERARAGRPVIQPHATAISETELAGKKASATEFRKDFSLEHSSPVAILPPQD